MTATVTAPPGARQALRHADFRWLLVARFAGFLGGAVAPVALAFAVLDLGGSVRDLGFVVGARSLANVSLLLAGGVLADRLPRTRLLQLAAVAAALTQAAVATLVLTGSARIGVLAALSAVNGAVAALLLPGAAALTRRTVPADLIRPASALLRLATSSAVIAGSAVAGVLVAAVGPGWGIAADAATFAVSAVCFGRIRTAASAERPPADGERPARRSPVADLREGWGEFVGRTWLWAVVLHALVLNAVYAACIGVLGPAVADASFGRRVWGVVLAAQTLGMVLGGLAALRWQPRRALAWGAGTCGLLAVPLLVLGTGPHPVLVAGAMLVSGVAIEQLAVAWDVSVQQHVSPDLLARVYSYDMLGSFVAMPLGQMAVGPVAGAVGTGPTLVGGAVLVVTATALVLTSRSVRSLRRHP